MMMSHTIFEGRCWARNKSNSGSKCAVFPRFRKNTLHYWYSRCGMVFALIAKFTLDVEAVTPGANPDLHTVANRPESTYKTFFERIIFVLAASISYKWWQRWVRIFHRPWNNFSKTHSDQYTTHLCWDCRSPICVLALRRFKPIFLLQREKWTQN